MNYHAVFIGGPIDGQERVLQVDAPRQHIVVPVREERPSPWRLGTMKPLCTATYRWVHDFETPEGTVFVYSIWDWATTMLRLWNRYAGGTHAHLA